MLRDGFWGEEGVEQVICVRAALEEWGEFGDEGREGEGGEGDGGSAREVVVDCHPGHVYEGFYDLDPFCVLFTDKVIR